VTVTERPLFGRLELERWDQPLTRHPAAVVYSAAAGDLSGWTYTSGPTTATSASTSTGSIESNSVVLHSASWSTSGQYTFKAQKTLSGLSVGRTYTYTARLAVDPYYEARIGLGTATSDWVLGKGTTAQTNFVQHTVTFTATATSHVFWREVRFKAAVSGITPAGAWIYADDTVITRKAWTELLPGAKWVPYIADATRCSIRRGGSRSGLGIKTDVGTMAFTLHNAQDPLNGGAFKSGQTVRAVLKPKADEVVYSFGFEDTNAGMGGWTANPGTEAWVTPLTAGGKALNVWSGDEIAQRTFTGLTPGQSYAVRAKVTSYSGIDEYNAHIAVVGTGTGSNTTTPNGVGLWAAASYIFTATATSHIIQLAGEPDSDLLWDDIQLYRTYPVIPVFTGTVSDVKASYPLDKATGKKRVSVTVEVADAVKIHGTTPRYGAMIGTPYYETFEQRITRLAGSALAPIEPPAIGAPREVYSF